jgi:hypothetical protein
VKRDVRANRVLERLLLLGMPPFFAAAMPLLGSCIGF